MLARGVDGFRRMYVIEPEVVAADRHPGYLTRRWALAHGSGRAVEVQHHHAHVAAVMAEHGLDGAEPVIGVAFDGTGFGTASDGSPQIWGGEVLVADYDRADRVAHPRPLPLPGRRCGGAQPLPDRAGVSQRAASCRSTTRSRHWRRATRSSGESSNVRCRAPCTACRRRAWDGCSTQSRRWSGFATGSATRRRPRSSWRHTRSTPRPTAGRCRTCASVPAPGRSTPNP
ncbi:MAG: hypothetical protein R2713_13115 [Ilumatobacteraceae bacterium]